MVRMSRLWLLGLQRTELRKPLKFFEQGAAGTVFQTNRDVLYAKGIPVCLIGSGCRKAGNDRFFSCTVDRRSVIE